MKKWFIIVLLAVMAGWAIFNTIQKQKAPVKQAAADPNITVGTDIGNAAPNFVVKTTQGKEVNLSQYRGKKVILNFWATWCGPCRSEMPAMEKFYQDMKDQGVEILAVNATATEKSKTNIDAFLKENNYTFPVLLDEKGDVNALYRVAGIPTSYILNEKGIIVIKHVGPMTYENMKEYIQKAE
ncbi:TlpA disulfide reductase family protein [Microbacteriaceae bacterium 4G12]